MKQIKETCENIKNFRLKLIELCIITISAIFILMSFSQNTKLITPAMIIMSDIIFIVFALIFGANRKKKVYEFKKGNIDEDIILETKSYEFTWVEYSSLIIYLIAIVYFGLAK